MKISTVEDEQRAVKQNTIGWTQIPMSVMWMLHKIPNANDRMVNIDTRGKNVSKQQTCVRERTNCTRANLTQKTIPTWKWCVYTKNRQFLLRKPIFSTKQMKYTSNLPPIKKHTCEPWMYVRTYVKNADSNTQLLVAMIISDLLTTKDCRSRFVWCLVTWLRGKTIWAHAILDKITI